MVPGMRAVLFVPFVVAACSTVPHPGDADVLVRDGLDAAGPGWHGAQVIADGANGGAARFDGKGARIELGACPVDASRPFTLRCRLRTTAGGFCTPLMARDGDAVGLSLVMGRQPGRLSFEAWSWQSVCLLSTLRVDDGRWHTIEAHYEPTTGIAALWVDGAFQACAELGPGGALTARLRLGDNIGAHQPFAGDLDDVEVLAATARNAELRSRAPVLPLAQRAAALRELRARLLQKTTPSLAADASTAWPARAAAVRAHVADAIGLVPAPDAAPLDVQVHAEARRDGARLQRVSWVGFAGQPRATGWLWTPEPAPAGRRPAVLNPHGHWENGAMHAVVQARCAAFARFGWVALAVDSVHVEDVASGVNSLGAMTWHNRRALDLLLARDDVDPARIACTGASGGAQQTYYLMALEDRLAAAAPVVMACYFAEIVDDTSAHCGCNHVPRLAAGTDVIEMCAVFAPRPVFFGSVTGDWTHAFPREGLPELTAHWTRLGGAPPGSRHADEGHNYDRPFREAVYAFLRSELTTNAAEPAVAEPAGGLFSLAEMQALAKTCPPVRLDARAMAKEHLRRRPKVDGLAALAPGLDLAIARRPLRLASGDDDGWRSGVVDGKDGVPIPVRVHDAGGEANAPWHVVVDPAGMATVVREGLPERCVLVDPRPYGEGSPFRAAWQRNGILLGRGEGYQAAVDLATACASLPGEAAVVVEARGECGVVAVLAAHLCARIERVVARELGPSYTQDGNRLPLCPELVRWKDLPELVAGLGARWFVPPR
jgi:hypothetical protein